MQKTSTIKWEDFEKINFCIGEIIKAEEFPEARKPAYILHLDLGKEIGIKKSSAQITHHYRIEELIGKQVLCITNFAPKQIGPIMSEVLVTGFPDKDGNVVLCTPDKKVEKGARLF